MSQPSNVNNILFSNYFETDKLCGIYEGSYSASTYNSVIGGYLYQKNIPHNFTRPVLVDGLFSTDNVNWTPSVQSSCLAYSDNSNIYILSIENTGTIYYRLACTWINNYDNTNPLIDFVNQSSSSLSSVAFDSRANYQKIYYNTPITLSNPGLGNQGISYISHNLGTPTNYRIFFTSLPGQVWPSVPFADGTWMYEGQQYGVWATNDSTTLSIYYSAGSGSASTVTVWPRIYYDD